MLCQIVVEAEAYSSAPGLLRRGLEELLQHLLATFTTILEDQLPGESPDLQHLLRHGFAPCVSDTSCVRMANSTPMKFLVNWRASVLAMALGRSFSALLLCLHLQDDP